jgi:dynein intermediate chain 1
MSKNELKMEPVMKLKLIRIGKDVPDEISFSGLAGGCCFDFHRQQELLFLVGTEEGKIHRCSRAYSGQYLQTYIAHNMPVYAIKWNPFHPDVFMSCSADWHIHIWDVNLTSPVISFDLGTAVGDIAWSPYSSTTFAAVSSEGKVSKKHEKLFSK